MADKKKIDLKVDDEVTVKGIVVAVDGKAVTIETLDGTDSPGYRFTLNGDQVTDSVSK